MTVSRPALAFEGVSIGRGRRVLVHEVTLALAEGRVHALLGHNGAGKTTLLRAVAGLVPIRSGRIATSDDPSVLFVGSRFPGEMRVRDLLEYRARLVSASPTDLARVRQVTGVGTYASARCGELSTGMSQRVALALALLAGTRTLLLDEPTTGLDPQAIESLLDLLRAVRADGCTVVLCSHDLAQLELVCDTVTCLRNGRLTASGSISEIAAQVPVAGHVVRTRDDRSAHEVLARAGIPAECSSRGLLVTGAVPLRAVWAALDGHAEVREVTVDRSLFDRIFDAYGSAPATLGRRARAGRS